DPERARAKLRVVYDSGPPFTLGKLQVSGLESYPFELVERYSTLRPGEPYDHERLLALQNALQNTRYFASVAVDVDPDPAFSDGVPVRVTVREARPKRVGLGAGFSSNTGARVETTYGDLNFLDRAWNLATGLRIDQKRQFGYADVYLPPTSQDYRDSFGVLAERSDIQGLMTQRTAAAVVRSRTRGRIETRLTLALQHENLSAEGADPQSNNALTLNYAWTYRAVDNLLDPRAGYVLSLQAGGGSKSLLSDQDFLRLHGRYQHYFPIGERDSLILRAELGHTAARSRIGIPQDFLFRTGGAQSVRGYAYESLGLKDGNAVVGGRRLAVASAEYVHWLDPKWGMAAFYDAGNAWDTADKARLAYGYGLGARWRSPAGPLAVDLAYGDRDRKVRLHFAVAVAF
ncbi:MAG: BamA/TamA family outer membrane protein, partial [Rhodocyclaceae bacterium]